MARRYRPISKVAFRVSRAAEAWAEVAALVREAAAKPGYIGPSPASIEEIAGGIEATGQAVRHWLAVTAAAPRRRRLDAATRAALAAAMQPAP